MAMLFDIICKAKLQSGKDFKFLPGRRGLPQLNLGRQILTQRYVREVRWPLPARVPRQSHHDHRSWTETSFPWFWAQKHNSCYRYYKLRGQNQLKAPAGLGRKLIFPNQDQAPRYLMKKPESGRYYIGACPRIDVLKIWLHHVVANPNGFYRI